MTTGEIDRELLEQESKKMEAKSLLNSLHVVNNVIEGVKHAIDKQNEQAVRDLLVDNDDEIEKLSELAKFLVGNKQIDARVKHDLNNVSTPVFGYLSLYAFIAKSNKKLDLDDIKNNLISTWDRFYVGAGSILLGVISKDTMPSEFNTGLNLDTIQGAVKFLSENELSKLKEFSSDPKSAYKEIGDKTMNFISDTDWDEIKSELGDRQVNGETSLIGNFILNALRNSIKDKIKAEKISLKIQIVGNELVIRVEDDGTGMDKSLLDPNSQLYIFKEGVSGTGSTGIGLANFDKLLASVGGQLYVVSKQKIADKKYDMTRFQSGNDDETKKQQVRFDDSLEHGTVFEIRLPITQKTA